KRLLLTLASILTLSFLPITPARAQTYPILDHSTPPSPTANYANADFRLWLPPTREKARATLILVPGSNGDWRDQVNDKERQQYATKNNLALVGVRFTDKPHDQPFIEEYANASRGSGQALLDALTAFATQSKHDELATAPLLLWGMSAGGQFNYEFVAWKPDRVAAFVVNKGGIYYSALLSREARNVPGILFIGGKDMDSRISTITGLFAVNRRGGALWALANEPGAAHVVGRSLELARMFFEDVLSARVAAASLRLMSEKAGFVADLKSKTFQSAGASPPGDHSTSWLPTE